MQKENKSHIVRLPEELAASLEGYGIPPGVVLFFCEADLNESGGFTDTYLVLSKEYLAVCVADKPGDIRYFSGYTGKKNTTAREWAVKLVEVSSCDKLDTHNYVAGGVLFAEIGGADTALAYFTGGKLCGVKKLCRIFGMVKEGKEPAEEDLKDESRELYCPDCGAKMGGDEA